MKKTIFLCGVCVFFFSSYTWALDPLHLKVRTIYPEGITTVGEAAKFLIEPVKYRLVTAYPAPDESAGIAAAKLSPLARSKKIMSIEKALLTIIGEENRLVVDHEHKLISFEAYRR